MTKGQYPFSSYLTYNRGFGSFTNDLSREWPKDLDGLAEYPRDLWEFVLAGIGTLANNEGSSYKETDLPCTVENVLASVTFDRHNREIGQSLDINPHMNMGRNLSVYVCVNPNQLYTFTNSGGMYSLSVIENTPVVRIVDQSHKTFHSVGIAHNNEIEVLPYEMGVVVRAKGSLGQIEFAYPSVLAQDHLNAAIAHKRHDLSPTKARNLNELLDRLVMPIKLTQTPAYLKQTGYYNNVL